MVSSESCLRRVKLFQSYVPATVKDWSSRLSTWAQSV